MKIGLERLCYDKQHLLTGRRFALVMNRASVDLGVRLACDVLAETFPGQLQAILTPQHGLWCEQQANMVETAHGWHEQLKVPVYSLYSSTRRPTDDMMSGIDCVVIDLQDVGTRVYTFIWTMLYCLQECAARGIPVVVLDRPNPIGGEIIEGPILDMSFRSFVGEADIPMRHGLTIGELATFFNSTQGIGADLTVVPLQEWNRRDGFETTGRIWVPPSPNMQTIQTAIVYPGQVLLEGTNLSEGRGTTVPFEVVGAPFIDPAEFCDAMQAEQLNGVRFLPVRFTPTFDKWAGQSCGGVSIHVTDRSAFRAYTMTVRMLLLCRQLYAGQFAFNPPPYEYETHHLPIDIISGSTELREAILKNAEPPQLESAVEQHWRHRVASSLLY